MYPNIGSNSPKPSAPIAPQSASTNNSNNPSVPLTNTNSLNPLGFSSFMSQTPNQNQNNQQSMQPNNNAPTSQPPYPSGPSTFPAPPGQTSAYGNSYGSSMPPPPANQNQYASAYSMPQSGQGPRPPSQAQTPYGQQNFQQNPNNNPNAYPPSNAGYPPQPGGYPPQSGYQPRSAAPPFQNPYGSNNPYAPPPQNNPGGYPNAYGSANPYGQSQPNQSGYGNPYQSGPPPQNNPYGGGQQGAPYGGAGYPGYSQPAAPPPYQSPYSQPPAGGSGYNNPNAFGAVPINERLRAIAGRYEISDSLAQRLNILQQFELVVLCDDSGSMNSPVQGTNGTRWDELRTIVQIIIEIGTIFDSNGVDVHFLNRPAFPNVTDARQVIESFHKPPSGLTPLTPALRRIFQSSAGKRGNDKRLLVFVATDGAPTDQNGNPDVQGLERLMRNERDSNTTFVTFLACTDDDQSVAYLSNWDRSMMNVDVVDDYKSERAEVQRARGPNFPFSFGDYVVKALLGAVDPQIDSMDEYANNYRPY